MSSVPEERRKRQHNIKEGLQFIQSPLSYPGTQEQYAVYLHALVRNLFNEGNDIYRECDWSSSLSQYSEALNIADYAKSEEILIPKEIIEKLHINRIACYSNMGFHDKVLEDCNAVLSINASNCKALYRKSKALSDLGRYREAYDAVAKCSLAVPQDEHVIKLTQELAQKLGFKIRKAYVRAELSLKPVPGDGAAKAVNYSVEDIEPDLLTPRQEVLPVVSLPTSSFPHDIGSELASVPIMPLTSVLQLQVDESPLPSTVFANGGKGPFTLPDAFVDDGDIVLGDDIDDLLDSAPETNDAVMPSSTLGRGSLPTASVAPSLPFRTGAPLLGTLPVGARYAPPSSFAELYSPLTSTLGDFCSSLNSFSVTESKRDLSTSTAREGTTLNNSNSSLLLMNGPGSLFPSENFLGIASQPRNDFGNLFGSVIAKPFSSGTPRHPLEGTHELRQACQICFVKSGPKLMDFTYHANLDHKCKKDILIGRIKNVEDKSWKKIRPRPTKTNYEGPYYICKDVAAEDECRYSGHCTFAYCQEEIDVWTLERKGAFSREAFFGGNGKISLTVVKLLQEHLGEFTFLCEKCFDHKPRMISKRNKDNSTACSHPVTKHEFEDNKCLVHILRETTVKYSKIRSFHSQCQLDLCRHEVRYGCLREDECFYAHSLIELKVWIMQSERGISHDVIAQESKQYWRSLEASMPGAQVLGNQIMPGLLNMEIKFVCAQCLRNGQVIEPDKNRKYCSAKAQHSWTKERRAMRAMSFERKKWMNIRPLPTKKQMPLQFDLCNHIASGKKCQYVGNCSFAHSPEEREVWTYMKDNRIHDIEQFYELWLKNQKSEKSDDVASHSNKENGKQIHMPTDYAEITVDFHCWMCGKNCNSEKQWQGHISSEKHKEKVFHTEDDQYCWQHRFPTGNFSICERYMNGSCTEGSSCKFAHGNAELHEWKERRKALEMKLNKARKDHLIAPNDNDFGKYSFLFKDLN
ncbi:zinc finger CCCH domain-containing protein 7A isoform X1 [Peromyscus leucopus]|uniref:zinc finger CCCH domain-containing protein 7A isoform X1 n=1 Tax=Peromyscus leucopus TaxID=10041 RepID=UPI0010A1A517|nr:zinc finger CCCH domain-containing protein 7A isoform X1 [Peromyscus leucopus]XP_028728737.1 zinc finger CCCH domain-containing protein 7A isoform X1 [Peromyscus leucopus]XP_028728738.1 zinc finger CCCH domain-containing protein 7A isoform X1 [Peromyscus leucopus]XP_028728739.1 zinc finger CCCH domain-containing protein 7A isoform X1 [Peromyscus leucopus]XP_037057241.1 zinc finger CCCH domain-containing protein 7A isoform X1 [Peromyscus leucopus]